MATDKKTGNVNTNMLGDSKTINALSDGILRIYEPSLTETKKSLQELTDQENVILDQIHSENLSTSAILASYELPEMFNKLESYQLKLVNIRKDMKFLHEKAQKLKKRASRIEQLKMTQEQAKQQKEAEIKKEEDLIAKPSHSNSIA